MEVLDRFSFSDADANHEVPHIRNTYRAAVAAGIELDGDYVMRACRRCSVAIFTREDV